MDLVELNKDIAGQFSRHPWELARIKVVEDMISRITAEPKLILDLGCGDLFVATALAEKYPDCKIIAVDTAFAPDYIERENEKSSDTRIHLYQKLEEVPENIDVSLVLLLDVIEHIEDDVRFLQMLHVHPGISEQTRILITVPAYQSLWTSHDVILGHYRRYTNGMLKRHIREAGFTGEEIGYFFTSLIPARFAEVTIEKLTGSRKENTDVGEWNKSNRTTRMIANVLMSDYRFSRIARALGIRLPGLSNYIVCRKRAS